MSAAEQSISSYISGVIPPRFFTLALDSVHAVKRIFRQVDELSLSDVERTDKSPHEMTLLTPFFAMNHILGNILNSVIDYRLADLLKSETAILSLRAKQDSEPESLKWYSEEVIAWIESLNIKKSPKWRPMESDEKAFLAEYVDIWANIPRFRKFVNKCIDEFYSLESKNQYKAPYSTICQSNGTGKSRLLCEFAKKHSSVYICLAPHSDSCFPKHNNYVRELLKPSEEHLRAKTEFELAESVLRLLQAAFEFLNKNGWDAAALFEKQNITDPDPRHKNEMRRELDSVRHYPKSSIYNISKLVSHFIEKVNPILSTYNAEKAGFPNPTIVLIIDEARFMLDCNLREISPFELFRRTLGKIGNLLKPSKIKIFAILADSCGKLSSFTPSQRDESLNRAPTDSDRFKLFDPFFLVCNMDIFADPRVPLKAEDAFKSLNIFKKGRPLWNGFLSKGTSENAGLHEAVDVAFDKLYDDRVNSPDCNIALSIACLNLRVALEIEESSSFAEILPARHMRFITGISSSRDMITSEYPSEPILSHAASIHMAQTSFLRPAITLHNCLAGLQNNFVKPEGLCSLMTQFVFILARDRCIFGPRRASSEEDLPDIDANIIYPPSFPCLTLREFLLQLHADSISTLKAKKLKSSSPRAKMLQTLLSASLNFSHFVKICYTPTVQDLRSAYLRGCAFACADNQAGIDLIIPLKLDKKITNSECVFKTTGEQAPQDGFFNDNDALLETELPQLAAPRAGPIQSDGFINEEEEALIKSISETIHRRQYPEEPEGTEFPLNDFSFLLVKTKIYSNSEGKTYPKMHPGNCGIMDPNTIDRPFFALRNNMRGKNPIKRMATDTEKPFRFGLVLGEFKTATTPCLNYHKLDEDEDLGDLITKLIDGRFKSVTHLPDMLDRLIFAGGGEINELKFSQNTLFG